MITIFSDCHFGFDYGKERENDSFQAVEEVMETALKSDLILIAGDIFDSRLPRTEVWARAMELLSKPMMKNGKAKLVKTINKEVTKTLTLKGIPVISIYGTHERRGRGLLNPIEALEKAGFVINLHCQGVVFDIGGRKVAIQGMSGVPERYAKSVLEKWNPKPIPGCYNILLLHQSIDPYIYSPLEPPTLKIEDLPQGFDLIVDGHVHWSNHVSTSGRNLVFPGSLIITQMNKIESEKPKGFLVLDNEKLRFKQLKQQRKLYYKEMEVKDLAEVERYLESLPRTTPKPLVRLRLKIEKPLDTKPLDKFKESLLLSLSKAVERGEKIAIIQKLREERLSVEEMGLKILYEKLGFEPSELIDCLVNENLDRVLNLIKDLDLTDKKKETKPEEKPEEPKVERKPGKRLPPVNSTKQDLRRFLK